MSTSFPTGLDTFPSAATLATHLLSTDPHSALHGNLGDGIAAVEAKVGVDGSAVTTSLDYRVSRLLPGSVQGRLTLTSGTPVTTSDVTAAGTVYFTPYNGDGVSLYSTSSSKWFRYSFSEISASLSGLTTSIPTDVFAYWTGSAVALELVNWTNGTTRATALTTQDGVYVKSGDATRLYLGTVCGSGAGTCEDSIYKRLVSNCFNRVWRPVAAKQGGTTWTYSTQAWRPANNTTAYQFQIVSGLGDTGVDLLCVASVQSDTVGALSYVGLGIDSTTIDSSQSQGDSGNTYRTSIFSSWGGYPTLGYHYFQPLEYGGGSGTQTWYGYFVTGAFGSCFG